MKIGSVLAVLALGLAAAPVAAQDVGLALGTVAAPVTIEDLDGQPVDLGTIVGKKPVVLEFWAQWCPICEALMPKMEAAAKKYGDRVEVRVVAVAVNETPRSIKRHLARHPVAGPVLWDEGGRATRAFAAPATSYVVALDRRGRVVYTGSGEDQDLERAFALAVR